QQCEGDGVGPGGPVAAVGKAFDNTDQNSSEGGAGNVSNATEYGGDEGFQTGKNSHQWVDGRIIHGIQNAAGTCQCGAKAKSEGNDDVVVDANQRCGDGIERKSAHGGADFRPHDDKAQANEQYDGNHEDGNLAARNNQAGEAE